MTVAKIVGWLTVKEASALGASGDVRNLESIWYGSEIPTIFMGDADRSWGDFITAYPNQDRPYIEALRRATLAKEFRASAYWMELGAACVPKFDDGTILHFSSGSWCDLQAAIWSEAEGGQYIFSDWDFATGSEEPVRDHTGALQYVFKHYFNQPGEAP